MAKTDRTNLASVQENPYSPASLKTAGCERELLDALLSSRLNPGERKQTVADLFDKYSSLKKIIYAPKRSLLAATKRGAIAHDELQKARALAVALAQVELDNRPVLSQYDELIEFCRTFLAGERREQFHVLFLDKAKNLISCDCLATGTIDHVAVYPRELFELALEYSAKSIILVHNHPSGKPQPSRVDIKMTRKVAKVGHYLGIILLDHIIVASSGTYSFRNQNNVELGGIIDLGMVL
ncbi:MAG: DNA repair protein RadC [Rhizobiaceae bacterium]|nr:DNA repair protein RadC [Rhizobiaceae bacterium]